MKIRILQLLCPSRHCIAAVVYESPDGEAMPGMIEQFQKEAAAWGLPMRCGICESTDVFFEDAVTVFTSMEQARPEVARQGALQAITGEAIRRARRAVMN